MGHDNLTTNQDAMSEQLADSLIVVTILVGIYTVVGIFGNLSVFYVYCFKYPRCNFKYFVISLAIIDLISCFTTLPAEIYIQRNWYSFSDSQIWLCKTKTYFNGFTVFISAFLLLLIAIDRFRKVCRPIAWQIKPRRAIQLCCMIFGIAAILASPAPLLWGKHTSNEEFDGHIVHVTMCERDDEYKNTKWPSIFLFVIFFLPTTVYMFITGVLYILILKEIFCGSLAMKTISSSPRGMKKDASPQEDSRIQEDASSLEMTLETDDEVANDSDVEERKVEKPVSTPRPKSKASSQQKRLVSAKIRLRRKTLTMFVLTVIFAVTTFLYFGIISKNASAGHSYVLEVKDKAPVLFFFWRLYFINHVINPFVYGIMDSRFREALRQIFTKKKTWTPK